MQPHNLKINDKIINDSKSIATKFHDSFGSIANTIDIKTPKSKANHKQYLRHANLLNPVTEEKVEQVFHSFSEKKTVGPHSIPSHILEEFKKPLSVPLTIIINFFYMTGIFLELCNIAHVIPVFKREDQLNCSNY